MTQLTNNFSYSCVKPIELSLFMYHYCMNFTSVPQGGLRKYCIDSQNWWRVIIAPRPLSLWALFPLCQAQAQVRPQCLFMCKERWSDRENWRPHKWHLKGFWPVTINAGVKLETGGWNVDTNLYVSCSAGSAHQTGQTSTSSPATSTHTASRQCGS